MCERAEKNSFWPAVRNDLEPSVHLTFVCRNRWFQVLLEKQVSKGWASYLELRSQLLCSFARLKISWEYFFSDDRGGKLDLHYLVSRPKTQLLIISFSIWWFEHICWCLKRQYLSICSGSSRHITRLQTNFFFIFRRDRFGGICRQTLFKFIIFDPLSMGDYFWRPQPTCLPSRPRRNVMKSSQIVSHMCSVLA